MKALIDPNQKVICISSWTQSRPYTPTFTEISNSLRVAQVEQESFLVAEPYFWVDCADDVVADRYYYDSITKQINPIIDAPYPGASTSSGLAQI